jgi:hypothetical protein
LYFIFVLGNLFYSIFILYMEDPGSLQSALLLLYEDDPRGPYYFLLLYFLCCVMRFSSTNQLTNESNLYSHMGYFYGNNYSYLLFT